MYPTFCGSRFSTGRLLSVEDFTLFYSQFMEKSMARAIARLLGHLSFMPTLLFFLCSLISACLLLPFLYLILFLLFPCANDWENTRA